MFNLFVVTVAFVGTVYMAMETREICDVFFDSLRRYLANAYTIAIQHKITCEKPPLI